MHRLLASPLVAAALLTSAAPASSGAAPGCATRVDDAHVIRAGGSAALVHARHHGHKELVLRDVDPSALRVAVADSSSCRVDLRRFERRWTKLAYELHARLRSAGASWEIRVRFVHYDAAAHILRARGRLEDHRSASRQMDNSTEIVFASTFVPFDSSF